MTDLEKDLSHTKACVERMDGQVTGLSHDLIQLSTDVKMILKLLSTNLNLNEYVHFYRGNQAQPLPLTHAQQVQLLQHKGTKRMMTPLVNCVKQSCGTGQKTYMLESDRDSVNSASAAHIRTNTAHIDTSLNQRAS